MDEEIKDRLAAEEQDDDLVRLKDKVVRLVKESRSEMSKNYDRWDKNNDVYCGLRAPDEEDVDARDHNEPEKMVVPMTFAQIQTFVAFIFLLFYQNRRFFELIGTGSEDKGDESSDGEKLLEADMRSNYGSQQVYQFLTNVGRFSIGIFKSWYETENQFAPTTIPGATAQLGDVEVSNEDVETEQEYLKYQGNRFNNVSPYNFFPDTRFPLSEWHKGAFVADETEWHINALKKYEASGKVAGTEFIEPMTKQSYEKHRNHTRLSAFHNYTISESRAKTKDDQVVCVTECQLELIPKDYGFGNTKRLVRYVIQVANDDRIIRAEPIGYMHDKYTYDVGLISPDMHQHIGQSIADSIDPIQEVISFLINARLMANKKGLENNMIVDPGMIDMASLESRSPWILTKKGAPKLGVDRFAKQLQFNDYTSGNFNDAEMLMKVMQVVTGVNENAMGQFHGGRRSATEARAVNSGSAARMKVTAKLLWDCAFTPLGQKMLCNHRQGITYPGWQRIIGDDTEERFQQFKPTDPSGLIGKVDHFVHDATLQSEKGFMAQSLQELVSAMMATPEVASLLNIDVGELIKETLRLRGIENIDRFERQPQPQIQDGQNPMGPNQIIPGPAGVGQLQGQLPLQAVPGGMPTS